MAFESVQIITTLNGITPVTGTYREDLVVADVVSLALSSYVGITSVRWELVGRPPFGVAGGAGPLPILLAVAPSASFTADDDGGGVRRDGSYAVHATINPGSPGETVKRVIVARTSGLTIAAPGGATRALRKTGAFEELEDDKDGIASGWATQENFWKELVRQLALSGSATTTLAQAYTQGAGAGDQTLVLRDADGGGVVIDATNVGFTGASALRINTVAGSPVVIDRATGRIGSGTAAPAQSLHIVSASPAVRLERSGGAAIDIQNVSDELRLLNGATVLARVMPTGGVRSDFGLAVGTAPATNPVLSLGDATGVPVSGAGEARIRFATGMTSPEYSVNGGAWTPFAGAGIHYDTIQTNGTPVTQRTIANFSSEFTVADNGGATRTDVSLAPIGGLAAGIVDRVGVSTTGRVIATYPMVAANVTIAEALPGANYRDGSVLFVQTLGSHFEYRASSSLTVDHLTVLSVSGAAGARWIRLKIANPIAAAQTTWAVDPANVTGLANDENTGINSGAPLRSWAEFGRRLADCTLTATTITVSALSGAANTDPLYLVGLSTIQRGTTIQITGATTQIATGTMSAVRNTTSSGNDHWELTDAANAGSFASWITTNLLHRTSGTSCWFWPYSDRGSNRLQVSAPINDSISSLQTLAPGDTYEVLTLPTFADLFLHHNTRRVTVVLDRLRVIGASVSGGITAPSSIDCLVQYKNSLLQGTSLAVTAMPCGSQMFLDNCCVPASVTAVVFTGHVTVQAGLIAGNGTTSTVATSGQLGFMGTPGLPTTYGGRSLVLNHLSYGEKLDAMVYDWTGATPFLSVALNSYVYVSAIGGERNTAKLMWSDRSSNAVQASASAINPAITTDVAPFNSDGTTFATLPAVSNVSLSSIYPFPSRVFETGGLAQLTYGAVADGQFVRRTGATLVGATTIPGTSVGLTAQQIGHGSVSNTLTGAATFLFRNSGGQDQMIVGSATFDTGPNLTVVGATTSALHRVSIGSDRTQTMNVGINTTVGPFAASHTNADASTSSGNFAAVRMQFGDNGFIVDTSPATAVGVARTWTQRFGVTIAGATSVASLAAGGFVTSTAGTLGVVSTIPAASVTGLFYQTAAQAGSSLTQRPTINFNGGLVAVDNAGSTRTDVATVLTAGRVGIGSVSNTLSDDVSLFYEQTLGPTLHIGDGTTATRAHIFIDGQNSQLAQTIRFRTAASTYYFLSMTRFTTHVDAEHRLISTGVTNNEVFRISGGTVNSGTVMAYTAKGDVALGGVTDTGAELATNATNGFVFLPRMAGAPVGIPERAGVSPGPNQRDATIIDATNRRWYWYDFGTSTWRYAEFNNGLVAATQVTGVTAGQVAHGSSTNTLTSDPGFVFDNINNLAGVGDVNGTTGLGAGVHVVNNAGSATRGLMSSVHQSASILGARMRFNRSRGTFVAPTVVTSGDETGTVAFAGYDGTNYIPSVVVGGFVSGAVTTGSVPQSYAIGIADAGANGSWSTSSARVVVTTTGVTLSSLAAGGFVTSTAGLLGVTSTIPAASVTGLFYQTMAAAGSSLTQRPILNFAATFSAVDNGGSTRTDVDLANTTVTPGSYTNMNATVNAKGQITAASSGSAGSAFYQTIQNSGVALTQRPAWNVGSGLTAVDNAGLTRTDVTAWLSTGLAGGQGVYGGTAAGESLTLFSTVHGTRGRILNGTWFALDEVNGRVLIGTQVAGVGAPLTIASVSGSTSIALTRAGDQTIEKQGSGGLYVGTLGAQTVALYTNGVTRLMVQATGESDFASLSAGGYVKAAVTTGRLSTVSTIPASDVTGLFYQTVASDGTPLTQRTLLNFTDTFAVFDTGTRTTVDLATVGPGAGTFPTGVPLTTIQSITVNAMGQVIGGQSGREVQEIWLSYGGPGANVALPTLPESLPSFWLLPVMYDAFTADGQVWEFPVGGNYATGDWQVYVYYIGLSGAAPTLTFDVTRNGSNLGVSGSSFTLSGSEIDTMQGGAFTQAWSATDRFGIRVTAGGGYSSGALRCTARLRLRPTLTSF